MTNFLLPGAALGLAAMMFSTASLADGTAGTAQQVIDAANAMPLVSTINGTVPPGEATLVKTSAQEMNQMMNGAQVRVFRHLREAGTRAPIHVHPFGGWTCVVSGQAVLYLEGAEPARVEAGQCVYMPPLIPMSNANPGPGPAVLLDNFVTPPDAPVWRIVETGKTELGNEFAPDTSEQVNPQ